MISLYGSTISRTAGQYPWTVLQYSQMIIIIMAESWNSKLRKELVGLFASAEAPKIFGPCTSLAGRDS